ncbi:MAG: DNA-binding protein [Rhodanobacteraceae bacterium]|nr:MAG: DNA-binding protein [Rhodanobacteraceae bacterium]
MANQQSVPQAVIDRLKASYPTDTRGLVREVATQMALAGDWPSSQRVRDLIQRGSMNTVNSALGEWKAAFLQKAGAKVDIPEIPESLVPAIQNAMKGLWELASTEARSGFEEDRETAQRAVRESAAREAALTVRVGELEAAIATSDSDLALARERVARLETDLAAEQRAHRDLATALEAEQAARADERAQFIAAARAESDKHAAAIDRLSAERRHEREALEGQLAFATRRIDEAREKAKDAGAAYDRECRRADRLEQEAKAVEAAHGKAEKALQDKLEAARAEIAMAQQQLSTEMAERVRAAERAGSALAEAAARHDALAQTLRDLESSKRRDDAEAEAVNRKTGRLMRRIEDRVRNHPEHPMDAEDDLFAELVAAADALDGQQAAASR